jgi:hypothetical protein
MQEHSPNPSISGNKVDNQAHNDLGDTLKKISDKIGVVWSHARSRRWLLSASAALGVLSGIILGSLYLQKSRVEGIYQLTGPIYFRGGSKVESLEFGSLNLAQFKALRALAADRSRIRQFSKAKSLGGVTDDVNLEDILADPSRQQKFFDIQYGASKADAKALADPSALKQDAGTVLGIQIKSTHRSAEVAKNNVLTVGAFLTDTLFLHELTNYSVSRAEELRRSILSAERNVLETNLSLKYNAERIRDLRQIAARIADTGRAESRTVLSLTKETVPYLPLPTQVAAIEVNNMELNLTLKDLELQVAYYKYLQAFYQALHEFATTAAVGVDVVKQLPKIKATIDQQFKNMSQTIKPASLSLELEIAGIEDAFSRRNRFLAPPATVTTGVFATIVLATLLGLVFLLAAFLWSYFVDMLKEVREESPE